MSPSTRTTSLVLALSDIDNLHYLRIKVCPMHFSKIKEILIPHGMLRNIRRVNFKGAIRSTLNIYCM